MTTLDSPTRSAAPLQPAHPAGRVRAGRVLLVAAGLSTAVLPILTDAVLLSAAHMGNPAWLPHAKLHTAMSFFAAAAMGGAAVVTVLRRPAEDRFSMGLSAFLGSAFWAGLVLAGAWPGTSYGFAGDPAYVDQGTPRLAGVAVYPNVLLALASVAVAVTGLLLTRPARTPSAR